MVTSNSESNKVLVANKSLSPQFPVPSLEGVCQSLHLGHHQDEVVKGEPPSSGVMFYQDILHINKVVCETILIKVAIKEGAGRMNGHETSILLCTC